MDQYLQLSGAAPPDYRDILMAASNTGMRLGEVKNCKWSYIDRGAVEQPHRDAILGCSFQGMDVHYVVVIDESLTKAMGKYTK
jgi:hypothetical protein